jgi:NADP-dependent aldehyde dehydrogenase
MSSINPVYLMPKALSQRGSAIAQGFVNSLLMGSGQFCTNPGLLIVKDSPELATFIKEVSDAISTAIPTTMLTPGIHKAYEAGVAKLSASKNVKSEAKAQIPVGPNQCRARLFTTTAQAFLTDHALRDEVFGSSSLLIKCQSDEEILQVTQSLEGQLTATIQMDPDDDLSLVKKLLVNLEKKVGRILFNGYPTGVEVCHSMVHGGPFPATSDSRATSVGTQAISRFLRPVSYQDVPQNLLPEAVRDQSDLSIPILVNGKLKI